MIHDIMNNKAVHLVYIVCFFLKIKYIFKGVYCYISWTHFFWAVLKLLLIFVWVWQWFEKKINLYWLYYAPLLFFVPGDLLNTGHRENVSFTAITINISCMRNISRVYCLHLLSKYAVHKNLFLSTCSKSRFCTKSHGVITITVDHSYFCHHCSWWPIQGSGCQLFSHWEREATITTKGDTVWQQASCSTEDSAIWGAENSGWCASLLSKMLSWHWQDRFFHFWTLLLHHRHPKLPKTHL